MGYILRRAGQGRRRKRIAVQITGETDVRRIFPHTVAWSCRCGRANHLSSPCEFHVGCYLMKLETCGGCGGCYRLRRIAVSE